MLMEVQAQSSNNPHGVLSDPKKNSENMMEEMHSVDSTGSW